MFEAVASFVLEGLVDGLFGWLFRGLARLVGLFSLSVKSRGQVPLRQLWQQPQSLQQEGSRLGNLLGQAFCIALLLIFWGTMAWVVYRHGWR
ncbi:hypothetical protein HER32_01060 [Hymenobacter sp. BT18]|uniref:hypothetical protein n=1 Tax=Hymenobacter sp. BT18 TaxID=2835648 RepID=UPI00143E23F0|nr:hypothetical protein [Hymenobacter sp. BT18]QIX59852.1 hypothetical protein HER32_01060 [Hymenobacter sp. BT18]